MLDSLLEMKYMLTHIWKFPVKNLPAWADCILPVLLQFFISLAKLHVVRRRAEPQHVDLPLTKLGSVSSICLMSLRKVLTCLETYSSLHAFPHAQRTPTKGKTMEIGG